MHLVSAREAEPVTIQAADAVRRIVEKLEGTLSAIRPQPFHAYSARNNRGVGNAVLAINAVNLAQDVQGAHSTEQGLSDGLWAHSPNSIQCVMSRIVTASWLV